MPPVLDDPVLPLDRARLEFEPTGSVSREAFRRLLRAHGFEPLTIGKKHCVSASVIRELAVQCREKQGGRTSTSDTGPDAPRSGSCGTVVPRDLRGVLRASTSALRKNLPATS